MTIRTAIATVASCTLLLATIGACAGYSLGAFAPEYYRAVFRRGREPEFDPVHYGFGQGLTQGIAAGVIVGIALVAIFSWRETRRDRLSSTPDESSHTRTPSKSLARRMLFVSGGFPILVFLTSFGLIVGLIGGARGAYHRMYLEEHKAIAPLLAGDPAFGDVNIHEYSGGGAWLTGYVANAADLERLESGVEKAIGKARGEDVLGVMVKQ